MSYNVAIFDNVLTAGYYFIESTAKIAEDMDAVANAGRVFRGVVGCYNATCEKEQQILQLFLNTVKGFMDITFCKLWLGRANTIKSGAAAGLSNKDRICLGDNVYVPNVIRIASSTSLLVADFLGAVNYLGNTVGLLNLGQIATDIASIPVFGVVVSYSMNNVRTACAIIGFVLSVADGFRDLSQNGVTLNTSLRIVGDIAKIVSVTLVGSTVQVYIILGLVASATAGATFLARFLMKEYQITI
jgi:hypothetical protein